MEFALLIYESPEALATQTTTPTWGLKPESGRSQ